MLFKESILAGAYSIVVFYSRCETKKRCSCHHLSARYLCLWSMAVIGVFWALYYLGYWLVYFSTHVFGYLGYPLVKTMYSVLIKPTTCCVWQSPSLSLPRLAHEACWIYHAQHLGLPFFREMWFIDCSQNSASESPPVQLIRPWYWSQIHPAQGVTLLNI